MIELKQIYVNDSELHELLKKVNKGQSSSWFSIKREFLFYKGGLYVPKDLQIINKFMHLLHSSLEGGHSGVDKTLYRVRRNFFWPRLKRSMKKFVPRCDNCQRVKVEQSLPSGLLQPLLVPEKPWLDISIDFIKDMSISKGHAMIWMIIDRLTKYSHFVSFAHPYSAKPIAQLFLQHIFRLHGFPQTIVSDRDSMFTSKFWREFFKLHDVQLYHSTAYHLQIDG